MTSGLPHGMASKKTVTLENLAALGADRHAAILTELADDNADVKGRLRLELAAREGGDIIAAEFDRRISALKTVWSFRPRPRMTRRAGRPCHRARP
jgi:hypothetical protein